MSRMSIISHADRSLGRKQRVGVVGIGSTGILESDNDNPPMPGKKTPGGSGKPTGQNFNR